VLATHLNFTYARRGAFLIDPQGKIAKHYKDVDPKATRPRCSPIWTR
jgi:peroxiredoxin